MKAILKKTTGIIPLREKGDTTSPKPTVGHGGPGPRPTATFGGSGGKSNTPAGGGGASQPPIIESTPIAPKNVTVTID